MLYCKVWFLLMANVVVLLSLSESRGGGRGGGRGGSFGGGVFGNWRKYKKSSNQHNGKTRRIVSSSPMHTALTKSLADNRNNRNSYPVQLFKKKLSELDKYRRYNLPPGGSYYHDIDRIPQKAVFVSQMPPRGSDATKFLATYLGLALGWKSVFHQQNHSEMEYPLPSPLNITHYPENIKYTKKLIINNRQNESYPLVSTGEVANIVNPIENVNQSTWHQLNNSTAPWGVVCMNIKFYENDELKQQQQINKLICYPAPPPSTSADHVPIANLYRTSRLIKPIITATPVQVAGDIIEEK